jgi:signal transduction histidine kinase
MESAASLVRHRFEMSGVALEVRPDPGLPRLRGDARLLEHLLVNILINACDASPTGTRVLLAARPQGGGACFLVEDHGKGIPEALKERVMEPFFTTKGKGKGTGIGLAIGREIARMHQGSLNFEPVQPHGTRVLIWLPGC